jgi:hypothetical protein
MLCLKGVSYLEMTSMQIFLIPNPGTVAEKRFAQAKPTRGSCMTGLQSL